MDQYFCVNILIKKMHQTSCFSSCTIFLVLSSGVCLHPKELAIDRKRPAGHHRNSEKNDTTIYSFKERHDSGWNLTLCKLMIIHGVVVVAVAAQKMEWRPSLFR
jgi:hypothetical protein